MVTEDGRKRFSQPEETWIRVAYPPLVDETTWERAQALKRERRSRAKRNTRSFYLLQHLLVCEECGLGFTVRTNHRSSVRKNGHTYQYEYAKPRRYYKCRGMQDHGTQCRDHPFVKADGIEELVWSEVAKVLQAPETIIRGLQAQATGQSAEALADEITRAERKVKGVQAEDDRAIRLCVAGKITETQLDRQRKFITERLETAQAELNSLKAQQRAVRERQSVAEKVLAWAQEIETGLDALTPEERQKVLRLVVDRVTMGQERRIRITLAIPAPEFVSDVSQRPWCHPPPESPGLPAPTPPLCAPPCTSSDLALPLDAPGRSATGCYGPVVASP